MNQANNKILTDFLESFPRHEIVTILNEIDTKIGSLHTISSKDFLYFNKLLKQYYSNIKEISTANNTISTFFNNDLPSIKEEAKEKNFTQMELLNDSDSYINKIIQLLSSINSSFNLLIVPVNNYKQNLITLKYILANLKLHLNYIELGNATKLQACIMAIENSSEKMLDQIEKINLKTELVSKQIISLKNNACISESAENSKLKDILKNVATGLRKISFNDYLPENFVIALNNHTQKCFSHMGEVITNIQFHDIIRQKMEHIQISQNELINEINELESNHKNKENQLNLIVKIPEITDIQVAQLLYTNKDYQTSIEKITNQLLEVGNEMKSLHVLYNSIHENSNTFEKGFVNQVVEAQNIFKTHYEDLSNNCKKTNIEVTQLNTEYYKLKNEYNTIFFSEKDLRKEARNFENLIKENGQNFGNELMRRLNDLFSDLQINSNSLKCQLNNITQLINSLLTNINLFQPQSKYHFVGDDTIKELSNKALEIKERTKEYAQLSTYISDEITQSLKKIEYYSYFKATIEEIVSLLNNINQIVNFDTLKDIFGDNKEYLEKIKNLYTMESERSIHNQRINSGKSIDDILNNTTKNSYDIDENDIELF